MILINYNELLNEKTWGIKFWPTRTFAVDKGSSSTDSSVTKFPPSSKTFNKELVSPGIMKIIGPKRSSASVAFIHPSSGNEVISFGISKDSSFLASFLLFFSWKLKNKLFIDFIFVVYKYDRNTLKNKKGLDFSRPFC